jgi:hypothetical protein
MCSYISGGWLIGVPDVIFHILRRPHGSASFSPLGSGKYPDRLAYAPDNRVSTLRSVLKAAQIDGSMGRLLAIPTIANEFAINCNAELNFS